MIFAAFIIVSKLELHLLRKNFPNSLNILAHRCNIAFRNISIYLTFFSIIMFVRYYMLIYVYTNMYVHNLINRGLRLVLSSGLRSTSTSLFCWLWYNNFAFLKHFVTVTFFQFLNCFCNNIIKSSVTLTHSNFLSII